MRHFTPKPTGELDIAELHFDTKSRDDIPPLLRGLQHLYTNPELREQVHQILDQLIPEQVNRGNGRPGMALWRILVLGTLRLNLNWDYDRLQEMANNHRGIRQLLGHGQTDDGHYYPVQTLKDNIQLFTPEVLNELNTLVVQAGHEVVKKKEEPLRGRCDSFVVETDVHYPTDTTLLFDALRTVIRLLAQFDVVYGLTEWQEQGPTLTDSIKRLLRQVQKRKHSSSKNPERQAQQRQRLISAHETYLAQAREVLGRAEVSVTLLQAVYGVRALELAEVQLFMDHARRQIDQIERRVLHGEVIPHQEKVFSLFEPHTEWLSKGKAGVAVELGVNVCVLEDQYQFILHHQVMQHQTDDQLAVPMVRDTQQHFPTLRQCSFDQGFHSPDNQRQLATLLDEVILPRKGRLSAAAQARQSADHFVQARCQHAAVESAINALEVHGLDRCPDHGITGFKRYVALAVLARNIQRLGVLLRQQEAQALAARLKKAA